MRQYKNNISYNVRNITLNLKNITNHFIGKVKIITLISTIIMLSFVNITLCLSNISNTSALSYSSDVNIGFTFNSTISLSISPDNLTIANLTPGTALDSNTITINVATNTAYGYQLTANVGDNTTNYNTTSLVHASSATSTPTSNATFTSLAYGSSVANKDNLSPNTWGYSYSNDSGTTWRPYSGLPLYSDTNHSANLISTYTAADSRSIEFKIAAKASETQPSGDYTNIINFYATSVPEPPLLYDVVEDMTKGTLAENNVKLSDTITQANSGVYTYDPTIYGTASDASNDYPIYFYRGVLDTDAGLGTYGSDGKADAWPNYVKLSNNTCWRIVRTTGSGGVKMIYNGMYGATTAGSCANATANAQAGAKAFNSAHNSIVYVGYTYNNSYVDNSYTNNISTGIVLGNNDDVAQNNTRSNIKTYMEDDWYFNNMIIYTNLLERNAGYCNDRSLYNSNYQLIATIDTSQRVNFGANYRFGHKNAPLLPTLICPRGFIDIYYYDAGLSEYSANKLKYPVALITADEATFAGNGFSGFLSYSKMAFLNSGTHFWLLSPNYRNPSGHAYGMNFYPDGGLNYGGVEAVRGVRPVVSLMHHIQVTGGIGTATSPWTIE